VFYLLQDEKGVPAPVYSVASGLDYPGVGPEHCMLHDLKRVQYVTISDAECIDAFYELSRLEGIIPALESAHAVAYALKLAKQEPQKSILVNLSGRGDKDVDFVIEDTACLRTVKNRLPDMKTASCRSDNNLAASVQL
jgi:tryptophan synthase beta chain